MNLKSIESKTDLFFISLSILIYLIINYFFHVDIIGVWESVSVYSSLEPGSDTILGNIQISADTTGGHGIGYPLILFSQYFAKIFTISFSSLKYIFLIYSIFFLIFYYYSIKYFIDSYTAFFSLILIIINPYFLFMSTMVISQQFTLTLIFLNILLFIKFEKNKSMFMFFLLSTSISLLLMNYILGRYLLVVIIFYFFFKSIYKKSFTKEIIIKNTFLFSKFIIFSLFLLIIIFPPNLGILFSKNLFLPFSALLKGGESVLYESNFLEIIFLNIKYITNTFFLNFNNHYDFNIINGEPTKVFPIISTFLFIYGFFLSLKNKNLILFNLLFITLFILIIFSNSIIEDGKLVNTSISVYRIYILIPILIIFVSYGLKKIAEYFFKNFKRNQIVKILMMFLLIILSFKNIINSETKYNEIEKKYSTNNNLPIDFFDKNNKHYKFRVEMDYHMKIRTLSMKLANFIENQKTTDKSNPQYFYFNINEDLKFMKYPPRLKNDSVTKYSKHVFYTLYLNDIGNENYTYIYKTEDEMSLFKKIESYKYIEEAKIEDSIDKIIAKKIVNFLKSLINFSQTEESYKIYKVNLNNNYKNIILYNEKEYLFAKNILGVDVRIINLSDLIR